MVINNSRDTFSGWRDYGLQRQFEEINSSRIKKSKNKRERCWYNKGQKEGWLKRFGFKREREKSQFDNFEKWKKYGLEHNYNERSPRSLIKSEDKKERSWYNRGYYKKWLRGFSFIRVKNFTFNNFKEWQKYGLDNNFDKRNSTSLAESKDKSERSWYRSGTSKKWLRDFEFKIVVGLWDSLDYTIKQSIRFIRENKLKELPSDKVIDKLGYSQLGNAISRYHGGFPAFRERLREYLGQPSQENQLESLLEDYVKGEE